MSIKLPSNLYSSSHSLKGFSLSVKFTPSFSFSVRLDVTRTWLRMDLACSVLFAVPPSGTNSAVSALASVLGRSPLNSSRQRICSCETSGYFLQRVPSSRLSISSSLASTSARVDTVSKGESKSAISPATSLKKDLAWAASFFTLEAEDRLSSCEVNESFRLRRLFCNIEVIYFLATRFCAVVITSSKLDAFKN